MENRINVAELLKDCQEGMKLDCTMFYNYVKVFFKEVISTESSYPIIVTVKYNNIECTKSFTKYGAFNDLPYSKCVIFPKGKDTWEGFQRPFKDGDILAYDNERPYMNTIYIYRSNYKWNTSYYVAVGSTGKFYDDGKGALNSNCSMVRFATEEEKERLFQAIKSNGYKWNAETKTLERLVKPNFKIGNVIQNADSYKVKIIGIRMEDECYEYESIIAKGIGAVPFNEQDEWTLVPLKFDINTLEIFKSKVLVRDDEDDSWRPAMFGGVKKEVKYPYFIIGGIQFKYLIPYEGNEHLCLSENDCDDFYKTWE